MFYLAVVSRPLIYHFVSEIWIDWIAKCNFCVCLQLIKKANKGFLHSVPL